MTQEEKELLLKDLCGRLPYGVKCSYLDFEFNNTTHGYLESFEYDDDKDIIFVIDGIGIYSEHVKPYLFPLSSMTEQQKEELFYNYIHNDIYFDDFVDYFLAGELWHDICVSMDVLPQLIDWLNKNHFDWRGLIPKGLAIDATRLNIY